MRGPECLPRAEGRAGEHATPVPPPAAWGGSLEAACARAVVRAREAGHAIVLAVSERSATGADPLAVLQELSPPSPGADGPVPLPRGAAGAESRFYWEHPAGGFALAAGGRALGWKAGGLSRFGAVRAPVEAALAEAEAWAPPGDAPLGAYAVGGFSFFDTLGDEAWPGFEPADLALPAWAAVRHSGRGEAGQPVDEATHWLVQTGVRAEEDPAQVRDRIEAGLARLHDAGARTTAASAGMPSREAPGAAAGASARVEGLDPPEAREHWTGVVRTARDAIRAGGLRKVVLARALELVCTPAPDPLTLLARLRAAYPECACFLADPGRGQAYLGATPERLARMEAGQVSLAALAGTVPRGATPAADAAQQRLILDSAKEREEHAIVVEAIRAALAGCGTVDMPAEPEARALKNVWHLFTPISLVPAPGLSLLDLVERLHPTPAVGGLPRVAALDAIRRFESFDRGWYGGPLGWLNARGEGEFAVTLRSGVVKGRRVRLFAGGGIVADSDPEREFEETRIKFRPLLDALGQE